MFCFLFLFATNQHGSTPDDGIIFNKIRNYFDAVSGSDESSLPALPELSLNFFMGGEIGDWYGIVDESPLPSTPENLLNALKTRNKRYMRGIQDSASHLVMKKNGYYFKFLNLTKEDCTTSDEAPEHEFFTAAFFRVLGKQDLVGLTGLMSVTGAQSKLYVQVTPEIEGKTLKKLEQSQTASVSVSETSAKVKESYAVHFIAALILRLGDAKLENYILAPNGIVSIDNEMIFRRALKYVEDLGYKYDIFSAFFLDKLAETFAVGEFSPDNIKQKLLYPMEMKKQAIIFGRHGSNH